MSALDFYGVAHFESLFMQLCLHSRTTPTHVPVSQSQAAFELQRISKNLAADKLRPESSGTVGDLSWDRTGLQTAAACLIGSRYRRGPGLLQSMER